MNNPPIVGFSQVLRDVAPFLANAARVAKDMHLPSDVLLIDLLDNLERDFAYIHNLLVRIFQGRGNSQAVDTIVQREYDFRILNRIIDRALLAHHTPIYSTRICVCLPSISNLIPVI